MSKTNTPDSLVKYETPILVSSGYKSAQAAAASSSKQKVVPPIVQNQKTTEDFLNMILPPQEIVDNNQLWVRYVSATPATTADVTNLKINLDKRTHSMEARDSGICPIREELFA
jgi:dynein light intermediate chain